ncbi:MAG: hypothetical protein DWQ37_12880 [Planctomycetota bacterium]|nr:MAG: hypothetical protein DWQ37_12880 [Planctomycetota bacterium]
MESAFADASYPGDELLASPRSRDARWELRDLFGRFARVPCTQVPPAVIEYHYDSLPFLSPLAYKCFLPAYITYAIDHAHDSASNVPSFLTYNLILPTDLEGSPELFRDHKEPLSREQSRAVLLFLEAMREVVDLRGDAEEAIEAYWKQLRPAQ